MKARFQKEVRKHQHRVFTLAVYLLRDRQEAEDITQEVLLKLWRHWSSLELERLGAWLLKVTRNSCIDSLRKRRSYRSLIVRDEDGSQTGKLVDSGGDPLQATQNEELRQRLESSLNSLQEPYQSLLILREIQGLSYAEIAEILELPLNTVKVYLHRGRGKLREQLREGVYS